MWFRPKRVYLDHAAATPVCDAARRAMRASVPLFGNPGALHAEGLAAKHVLEDARAAIAQECAVKPRQIIFVSGSTEGNNLAILGVARRILHTAPTLASTHWITSAIEHPSVLEAFAEIERLGGTVTHLDPDEQGFIRKESLARALRGDTILVSIGWANHEIGTLQDIRTLARIAREHVPRVFFHTDMGQAPLFKAPHVHTLGVDLATLGAGKLYGPRGIGALFVGNRVELASHTFGGSQERGLRAGTEDPVLTAGFAAALRARVSRRGVEGTRLAAMRARTIARLKAEIPGCLANGAPDSSLPHLINVSVPGIQSEYVVLALDKAGFAISTRSACAAHEGVSHVVAALKGESEAASWRAQNTLRISMGPETTVRDMDRFARELARIVAR